MKFHIPLTTSRIDKLKKRSCIFSKLLRHKKDSKLEKNLKISGVDLIREEYIGICINSFVKFFIFLFLIFTTIMALLKIKSFLLFGLGLSLLFSLFIFFSQMIYPKIYVTKRQRNIDKNLIPAMEDVLVQLNSGIPLFSVLVNISSADYGELSVEFKKVVKRINAGEPEIEVLDELGEENPSLFFRRMLWQISNGLRAGSNMTTVIKNNIKGLNEEQLIQIQNYGNKLNPLIMFYMLISVIVPALSITFLTIISSMVGLEKTMATLMFIGLFVFVVIVQIMFLGIIKSKRPRLL